MTVPRTTTKRRAIDTPAARPLAHLTIECVSPQLDCGRFFVKRVLGDSLDVEADIYREGHAQLAARVRYRGPGDDDWRTVPLAYVYERDRWGGGFPLDRIGMWTFTVDAWTDEFGTWRSELQKKVEAGQDVTSELLEGASMVEKAARRARFGDARTQLRQAAGILRDATLSLDERLRTALDGTLLALMIDNFPPSDLTTHDRELRVWVDRDRARFGAWYEMFPRSLGPAPGVHGTFATAARGLPRIADLGFDVVYLPPIHPIGTTNRKGKNNALAAEAGDVGSPWAIGNAHGGHTAVDPNLGTIEDFERFVAEAHRLGLEVALDYALQCSPDHPWLVEHPDWFFVRPDGTIKYAENPPKKYQDIYPMNFWCEDREGLWNACLGILTFWIDRGVHIFRVDNPHTKPFAFWEWVIGEVHARHPEVVFLSEAFTRPKKLKRLAKLGFTQSYTYFTWKTTSWELREYLTEITTPPVAEYLRGNLFANTPDILHEYLQHGGRAAFRVRLLLAATLSSAYGIYSGYELAENVPVRAGSEEYLGSEKYELRWRDFEAPGNIGAELAALNRIRRENRALQLYANLAFHRSDNERILFYRKSAPAADGWNHLLIAANLDAFQAQETVVHVPLDALGLDAQRPYVVQDLLTGARYTWRGSRNYVRLDPREQPGHVLRLEPVGEGRAFQ